MTEVEKEQTSYSGKPPKDGQEQFVDRWRENGYNCFRRGTSSAAKGAGSPR